MDERCECCAAGAAVYYCDKEIRMFLCGLHYRLWREGEKERVLEDAHRRHTGRMRMREAKIKDGQA